LLDNLAALLVARGKQFAGSRAEGRIVVHDQPPELVEIEHPGLHVAAFDRAEKGFESLLVAVHRVPGFRTDGGRVTLSGELDEVRRGYQRSRVRFAEHVDRPPMLDAALAMEGSGRLWSVVHSGSLERFHHSVIALGGEVVESRDATLEEIFLARAGRSRQPVEAEPEHELSTEK
jgi:hypothetical protein